MCVCVCVCVCVIEREREREREEEKNREIGLSVLDRCIRGNDQHDPPQVGVERGAYAVRLLRYWPACLHYVFVDTWLASEPSQQVSLPFTIAGLKRTLYGCVCGGCRVHINLQLKLWGCISISR